MRLLKRKALVTGAGSRGIGREIALAYAREGADVAVHHFGNPRIAQSIVARIRKMGRKAVALEADLSLPQAGRGLVEDALRELGGLDILVAAAGTNSRKPFLGASLEDWDRVLAINLRSVFECAQAAARHMVARRKRGRIVFITSALEDRVEANMAAYCASKGGLRQLARALALELAPRGITVNAIAPGPVLTDLTRGVFRGKGAAAARARVPLGRIGMPRDLTGAAIFLASDEAAFVTGASLPVDGGRSLG